MKKMIALVIGLAVFGLFLGLSPVGAKGNPQPTPSQTPPPPIQPCGPFPTC